MEPETTPSPSRKKTFLKIALGVLAIFLVLATTAFVLTAIKNAKLVTEVQIEAPVKREYTQEEKSQILAHIAQESFKDATPQSDKSRILQSITKQEPKLTAVSTADKVRILQELEARAGQ